MAALGRKVLLKFLCKRRVGFKASMVSMRLMNKQVRNRPR